MSERLWVNVLVLAVLVVLLIGNTIQLFHGGTWDRVAFKAAVIAGNCYLIWKIGRFVPSRLRAWRQARCRS